MNRYTCDGHREFLSTATSDIVATNDNEAANLQHLHEECQKYRAKRLDTRSANIALLCSLDSMRNLQHIGQHNFNLEYSNDRDVINSNGARLAQQLYLQRQQHQHTLEQNLLNQRLAQLQQIYPLISYEIPGLNRRFETNRFIPSLNSNTFIPNLPRTSIRQENLLDIFLPNTIDRSFLQQNNHLGSSSLPIMNSLDGSSLCDSNFRHIQQFQRPPEIVTKNAYPGTEQYVAVEPTSRNVNDSNNNLSDSVGPDRKEQAPIRALSAYNFFFRYKRERILNSSADGGDIYLDLSEKNQEAMLKSHWNRDRTVKRRHRKSHGKISFAELSKKISQCWKELPEHHKNFFNEVAARDWARYHREMEQHKQKKSDPECTFNK